MARSQAKTAAKSSPLYFKFMGAVVSLIIFIVVVELALRIVDVNLYYKNQFFPINRDINFPDIYEKDSKLFWRFRRNFVTESKMFSNLRYHINSRGMRGPEISSAKRGYRIIALGNSCTFGWGVSYEASWVYHLQEILKQELQTNDIEIINGGVPGYSSHQGKIFFAEELLSLNPDMVLVMFGWNDHWKAGHGITDAQQQMPHRLILAIQNLFSKMKLYQLLRKIVLSSTEKERLVALDDLSGARRVSEEEFYKNLKSIVRLARDNKIEPVLLIPPIASLENYYGVSKTNLHLLHSLYQKQIIRLAESEQVVVVDLQAALDQYNDLFEKPRADPIHFNVKGQAIAAAAIADQVAPLLASH
jgi:lysophospholipase L1-like esterase